MGRTRHANTVVRINYAERATRGKRICEHELYRVRKWGRREHCGERAVEAVTCVSCAAAENGCGAASRTRAPRAAARVAVGEAGGRSSQRPGQLVVTDLGLMGEIETVADRVRKRRILEYAGADGKKRRV